MKFYKYAVAKRALTGKFAGKRTSHITKSTVIKTASPVTKGTR